MGRNSRRIDCEYTNDAIMTNDGLIIGLRTICESQNSFSGFIDSLRIHRCSRTALIEDTCVIKHFAHYQRESNPWKTYLNLPA